MHVVTVTHRTTYQYAFPVTLDEHELMVRPMAAEDLLVLDARLHISGRASVRPARDAFGNVRETVAFGGDPVQAVTFVSHFTVHHTPRTLGEIEGAILANGGERLPPGVEAALKEASRQRRGDPAGDLRAWARSVAAGCPGQDPLDVMVALNSQIFENFRYRRRDEPGTQDPLKTLSLGTGTCRDFAFLLIEAARSLGLPARFVSGYLYNDAVDADGTDGLIGGGATHGWAQVHMAGAGWVDFDPTNDMIGGRNLIRAAVTLDPSDAVPISGSFRGPVNAAPGMVVDVTVGSRPSSPHAWRRHNGGALAAGRRHCAAAQAIGMAA